MSENRTKPKKNNPTVEQLQFAETEKIAVEIVDYAPRSTETQALGGQIRMSFCEVKEQEQRQEAEAVDDKKLLKEYVARQKYSRFPKKSVFPALARFDLPEKLTEMARNMDVPLYVVGGAVRNFLLTGKGSGDWDIAAPCDAERALTAAKKAGLKCTAVYPRTNTFRLKDGDACYEFTSFRTETYAVGGGHSPIAVERTDDAREDALRRDFKCNAVYYDVLSGDIVDPLGGVDDIERKILSTTRTPNEVFGSDGLRLMRLARFSGELGFTPAPETLAGATVYADNILDIVPERIYEELQKILLADTKYRFSPRDGHYRALQVLSSIGVLDRILPELTAGRGIAQRADYHDYDVFMHGLRAALYAKPNVRFAALLHDVGKAQVWRETGKFHGHDAEGSLMAQEILARLKAPVSVRRGVSKLIALHMYDLDGKTGKNKLRAFLVKNIDCMDDLLDLKQADYRACKDDTSVCPTILRWQTELAKMKEEGVPFGVKDLAVTGDDLAGIGLQGKQIGEELQRLLGICVCDPSRNERQILLAIASKRVEGEDVQ